MRLFAAVETEALRGWLGTVAGALERVRPDLRWLQPEKAHLTLAFLGEQPQDRVEAIREAMAAAARGSAPFRLELGGLGAFDSWSRARVIWLGALHGAAELTSLAERLQRELRNRGFRLEERRFRAHLTVGRARVPEDARDLEARSPRLPPAPPLDVREIALVRSFPEPAGSRYERVASVPLGC